MKKTATTRERMVENKMRKKCMTDKQGVNNNNKKSKHMTQTLNDNVVNC